MGNPLRIFFWDLQLWIEGILTAGYRILRLWIGLVDVLRRSPDPKCDLFWGGIPCKFFIMHFPCWNWKKMLMTWSIRLGYQACSSPIPKRANVWTHTKGESLAIFLFCILQSGIKRILTRGFARGCGWSGWCSKRRCVQPLPNPTDVYLLHLTCRDILNKTSILTVVGGSAGVSLS